MGALVLVAPCWPLDEVAWALGQVVGRRLGARVVRLVARPPLGMYDMLVVVAPTPAFAAPTFLALAGDKELQGKTIALVTDAPPALGPLLYGPWCQGLEHLAGATCWPEALHHGPWVAPAWPLRATPEAVAATEAWAGRLAEHHPPPTYPRGEPGRRRTDA